MGGAITKRNPPVIKKMIIMISSIQISLKSFEYKLLETATSQILAGIPSTWKISEFVLPLKIKKFTVLRSPHIDKKSREQFQIKFYKKNISVLINQEDSELKKLIFIENLKYIQFVGIQLQVQILYKSYFI